MAKERRFQVSPKDQGQTLAALLRREMGGLSWNEAKRLVARRQVRVSGALTLDDARRLKTGEVVEVFAHSGGPPPNQKDIVVRYQDEHLIVIEKPAGVTTLRHAEEREWSAERKNRQPTLEELVGRVVSASPHEKKPAKGKTHPLHTRAPRLRVRPVHRLDRETSGLMLFALSPAAETALVSMFTRHDVDRAYRAVVIGKMTEPRKISNWLVRDRGDGLRGSSPLGKAAPDAKLATTHVKPIEPIGDDFTLVECRLETGRTHQIRIHLAEIGHMLCGEKVYTRPTAGAAMTNDTSRAPRVALHSTELSLTHPITGRPMTFASPWPKDLTPWLDQLRRRSSNSAPASRAREGADKES